MPTCEKLRRDIEEQALGLFNAPRCTDLVGLEKQIAEVTAHMKYTWPEQRCEYYDAKVKRARQQQQNVFDSFEWFCSFSNLSLYSCFPFVSMLFPDGLAISLRS